MVARLLGLNDPADGAGGSGSASKPASALDCGKATGLCGSCNNGDAGREDSSSCALVVRSPELADVLQRNSCGGSVYHASRNKPCDFFCMSCCVRGVLSFERCKGGVGITR
jgi:hypothetical protein